MESGAKADPRNLDYTSPPTASTHSRIDARFAPYRLTVLGPAVHSSWSVLSIYLSIYLSRPCLGRARANEKEKGSSESEGGRRRTTSRSPGFATSPVDVLVGGRMGKRRDEDVWRLVPERWTMGGGWCFWPIADIGGVVFSLRFCSGE